MISRMANTYFIARAEEEAILYVSRAADFARVPYADFIRNAILAAAEAQREKGWKAKPAPIHRDKRKPIKRARAAA